MSDVTPIVFVVDDDVSVRESLELLVRCEGWQPETFASAQAFLDYPRVLVPNCLVLDVSLPGLNGLDLQRLVAVDRRDMPIIFITGHGDVPMTVQAMKAGAVEFLTKPFNDDLLLTAIQAALERSRVALGLEAEMRVLQERYASLSQRERPRGKYPGADQESQVASLDCQRRPRAWLHFRGGHRQIARSQSA